MNNLVVSGILFIIGVLVIFQYIYNKQLPKAPSKYTTRVLAVVEDGNCKRENGVLNCEVEYSYIAGSTKHIGKYAGPAFKGISNVKGGSIVALYDPANPGDSTLYKEEDETSNTRLYFGGGLIIASILAYLLF